MSNQIGKSRAYNLSTQATYGNGLYGTFAELYQANLVVTGFALASVYRGCSATMTVTPPTTTTPARFVLKIVPQEYGRTGIRSFYIDETGVLRGADKHGLPADETDPPIDNNSNLCKSPHKVRAQHLRIQ